MTQAVQFWEAYQRELSVHRVGKIYGVSGETVRAHLLKAGHRLTRHRPNQLTELNWSAADVVILKEWYSSRTTDNEFDLDSLALRLGRLKSNVSRKARSLGLTNKRRRKLEHRKPPKPNIYATVEERKRAVGERVKRMFREKGHPRGSLGMKHTTETLAVLSEKSRGMWADPNSKVNSEAERQRRSDLILRRIKEGNPLAGNHPYSRCKRGFREDIGEQWFKSAWEANYARYLTFLKSHGEIVDWEYEPHTFYFEVIKRGTRSYTPDFKVTTKHGHEWHEVKGWMDSKSKTRIARMAKYFPGEKLIVIDSAWFKRANRQGLDRLIPNWEKPEKQAA